MNKKVVLVFLAGWLFSLLISPSMLVGVARSVSTRSS